MLRLLLIPLFVGACTSGDPVSLTPPEPGPPADRDVLGGVTVTDEALSSGYLDLWSGELMRGRACLAGDFDGDGRTDIWTGNPGDTTALMMNRSEPGKLLFEPGQIITTEEVYWGGVVGDFDNDGDPDVFVSVGGNELKASNVWFRNDGDPDAPMVKVDTTLDGSSIEGQPLAQESTGALAFDFDHDGWLDIYTSNGLELPRIGSVEPESGLGLNQLWRNNTDGTFRDHSRDGGLLTQYATRNSSVLDYDNDGDIDIFENNWYGPNTMHRNDWIETSVNGFVEVDISLHGDHKFPVTAGAMCSIASDLNGDGFEDLIVFRRREREEQEPEIHNNGHLVWLNHGGEGFIEVGAYTNLNQGMVFRDHDGSNGVMGCQAGDLNADGYPDLFMGNGNGQGGTRNTLMLSYGVMNNVDFNGFGELAIPWFVDASHLIDFPSELPDDYEPSPLLQYPYRTHGTCIVDLDGDGFNELVVHNGGPSQFGEPGDMQEPDRLFKFHFEQPRRGVRVQLEGDGVNVNRDAVGARVHAVIREAERGEFDVWVTRKAGSGFAADNGGDIFIGLGTGDLVSLEVLWPDGQIDPIEMGPEANMSARYSAP